MPGWIYLLVALAVTAATANFIRRIRALQSQDRDRAADVSRTTPLGMEATSQARFDLENRAATFGGTGNAVSSCNDTLDQAVSRTWALAARLNPPQHHSHMTGRASATNLVKGIAQMNPVTLFLATSIDMASEDDQILIDLFKSLQTPLKIVDVSSDSDLCLGLPQIGDTVDLPHLYIRGLPFGGLATILNATRDGTLIETLSDAKITYDKATAAALFG